MAIQTGLNWKFAVDTNESPGGPNWVTLPQQQSGELNWTSNDADATHKDNAGWADSITTSRSWTATVSGFMDPNDTAIIYCEDTVAYGSTTDHAVYVRLINDDGDTFIGKAKIDSLGDSFGYDEVTNYSYSFTGRAAPTLTRA